MRQTIEYERIKPEPLARIIETAAPVATKETLTCTPGDLVEMPLVFGKGITRCFCAKSGEATIGQGAAFAYHR
jgi:hypothetical protein